MSRMRGGIFTRRQGGVPRWYGRLADGRRVALRVAGSGRAVIDEETARVLYAQLVAEEQKRALRGVLHVPEPVALGTYAEQHLVAKRKLGTVTTGWIAGCEAMLTRATAFLGSDTPLAQITTARVREFAEWLLTQPNGPKGTLTAASVAHHLGALSNMMRRAVGEGLIPANPVSFLLDKPQPAREEARWLPPEDCALLLETARVHKWGGAGRRTVPCLYPLLATLMLTGMRESECLGLLTADVSFDRGVIVVAPNQFRRLKTKRSARVIPLWPQLKEILTEYLATRPSTTLLFPSYRTGKEGLITDWRKTLDTLVEEAGELYIMADGRRRRAAPGDVRSKAFRHGYASARLQTSVILQPEWSRRCTGTSAPCATGAMWWSFAPTPSRLPWGSA